MLEKRAASALVYGVWGLGRYSGGKGRGVLCRCGLLLSPSLIGTPDQIMAAGRWLVEEVAADRRSLSPMSVILTCLDHVIFS